MHFLALTIDIKTIEADTFIYFYVVIILDWFIIKHMYYNHTITSSDIASSAIHHCLNIIEYIISCMLHPLFQVYNC